MVRVRWEGNGSTRSDGRVQDIARRFVLAEDVDGMAVGSAITVKWGRRRWKAVVVDLLQEKPKEATDSDDEQATEPEEAADSDADETTEPPPKKSKKRKDSDDDEAAEPPSKKTKKRKDVKKRKVKPSHVLAVHEHGGTCTCINV